jgi:hypothetical protein
MSEPLTYTGLRMQLGVTVREFQGIKCAAEDARLPVRQYVRLMVLAAAGFGGVTEHLERAIGGSFEADKTGTTIRVRRR